MSVPRLGYYVDGDCVRTMCRNIQWDKGWSYSAKKQYVEDLHLEMRRVFPFGVGVLEVTTAGSPVGKMCSPVLMKFENGESFDDAWQRLFGSYSTMLVYDGIMWPKPLKGLEYSHFYCFYAQHLLPVIRSNDVFTDVFYNPTKPGGSQGEACAIMKLLDKQGNMDILKSVQEYSDWYIKHVKGVETMANIFYFTTVGDCVVECPIKETDPVKGYKYLVEKVSGSNPIYFHVQSVGSLYNKCKAIIDVDEDLSGRNWFLSADKDTALAGALVSVIEHKKCWNVLDTPEAFEKWLVSVRR